ncbi:hypothetical protein D3C80_2051130 [compost metagenome]
MMPSPGSSALAMAAPLISRELSSREPRVSCVVMGLMRLLLCIEWMGCDHRVAAAGPGGRADTSGRCGCDPAAP